MASWVRDLVAREWKNTLFAFFFATVIWTFAFEGTKQEEKVRVWVTVESAQDDRIVYNERCRGQRGDLQPFDGWVDAVIQGPRREVTRALVASREGRLTGSVVVPADVSESIRIASDHLGLDGYGVTVDESSLLPREVFFSADPRVTVPKKVKLYSLSKYTKDLRWEFDDAGTTFDPPEVSVVGPKGEVELIDVINTDPKPLAEIKGGPEVSLTLGLVPPLSSEVVFAQEPSVKAVVRLKPRQETSELMKITVMILAPPGYPYVVEPAGPIEGRFKGVPEALKKLLEELPKANACLVYQVKKVEDADTVSTKDLEFFPPGIIPPGVEWEPETHVTVFTYKKIDSGSSQ